MVEVISYWQLINLKVYTEISLSDTIETQAPDVASLDQEYLVKETDVVLVFLLLTLNIFHTFF